MQPTLAARDEAMRVVERWNEHAPTAAICGGRRQLREIVDRQIETALRPIQTALAPVADERGHDVSSWPKLPPLLTSAVVGHRLRRSNSQGWWRSPVHAGGHPHAGATKQTPTLDPRWTTRIK